MCIDFLMNLMPNCLLCGYTAIKASLLHSSFDGDIEAISFCCNLWLVRGKCFVSAVPPLYCRFRRSTFNVTLQQCPVICLIKICYRWLWSSTCEQMMMMNVSHVKIRKILIQQLWVLMRITVWLWVKKITLVLQLHLSWLNRILV